MQKSISLSWDVHYAFVGAAAYGFSMSRGSRILKTEQGEHCAISANPSDPLGHPRERIAQRRVPRDRIDASEICLSRGDQKLVEIKASLESLHLRDGSQLLITLVSAETCPEAGSPDELFPPQAFYTNELAQNEMRWKVEDGDVRVPLCSNAPLNAGFPNDSGSGSRLMPLATTSAFQY